jgi:hypothetical protein
MRNGVPKAMTFVQAISRDSVWLRAATRAFRSRTKMRIQRTPGVQQYYNNASAGMYHLPLGTYFIRRGFQ